ncbi:MAG TPA: MFS transporter [Terriglobales bacterium]|nr:MFS transporter [Terriglobales bacterium]
MVASEARTGSSAERTGRRQLVRAVAASALASTAGWYDFFLFGYAAATVLGRLFFPASNAFLSALLVVTTYAVGFVIRPVGASLFGHLGDRIGRKATLTATLLLAGLATALVAAVPTYAEAGVLGGLLLVLLRLAQGLAVGGQWAGAVLLSVEWGHRGRRGFLGSWTQIGLPAGLALAYGSMQLFTSVLGEDTGWRIPFLFSIVLIAIAIYIRLGVRETPIYRQLLAERRIEWRPVAEVLVQQWREVGLTALLRVGQQTAFILFTVFLLGDAIGALKLQESGVLTLVLITAAVSVLTLLGWGFLSDIVGRKRLVMIGAALLVVWSFPYWALLGSHVPLLVLFAILLSLPIHDMQYAPQAALIAETFTGRVRYSGTALGSQLTALVADGPAVLIALGVLHWAGDPRFLAIYLGVAALVSLLAAAGLKDRSRQDMSAEYDEPAVAPAGR